MMQVSSSSVGAVDNYVQQPAFYIAFLGGKYENDQLGGTQTNSYQLDAAGYAGSTSSVAVVESTYNVSVTHTSQDGLKKYLNHGGP
jgi:hypothetical protein